MTKARRQLIASMERAQDAAAVAKQETRDILAAVRAVFELTEYEDKPIEIKTQTGTSWGSAGMVYAQAPQPMYTVRTGIADNLPRLKADLLAASKSVAGSDALARLTKKKPASVTVNVKSPSAGMNEAAKRAVRKRGAS